MTLDAQTLSAVIAELSPLIGARIQRADVFDDQEIVLELRCPGRTLRLLISARPTLGRVHLIDRRPPKHGPGSSLQGLIRKHLEGRPLVWLGSADRTVVIGVPLEQLRVRLDGGKDPLSLLPAAPDPHPHPHADLGQHPLAPGGALPDRFPISEQVCARYEVRAAGERERILFAALVAPIDARLKKLRRLLSNLDGDRARLLLLAADRRAGELLKGSFRRIHRGMSEVVLTDYETSEPVTLALDPALDGRQNLERLFARAKKADRGLPLVAKRHTEIESMIAELARARDRIVEAKADLAALERIAAEQGTSAAAGARASAPAGRARGAPSPLDRIARRFTGHGGAEILVGKDAAANDRLTLSFARGHDLWLHARGVAGAHVLLRLERNQPPPQEALLDAAHLAAHYSDARREPKVEVVVTEARYVKKLKGAPAGQVSLSREKTILLLVQPARLSRLLGAGV
jgi:predicted ribosome quality control (RQC) complex YloA/Tae2 family protein